jgi:hypothetical protein
MLDVQASVISVIDSLAGVSLSNYVIEYSFAVVGVPPPGVDLVPVTIQTRGDASVTGLGVFAFASTEWGAGQYYQVLASAQAGSGGLFTTATTSRRPSTPFPTSPGTRSA